MVLIDSHLQLVVWCKLFNRITRIRLDWTITMYTRRSVMACLSVALLEKPGAAETNPSYKTTVEGERNKYAKEILATDGPLTGIARFIIHDGDKAASVGTDSSCSCVFPSSSGPAHLGDLTITQGKANLHFAPGLKATVKGKIVSDLSADSNSLRSPGAELDHLTVNLSYNPSKARAGLTIWDSSVKVGSFSELKWFPIDPKYSVVANWIPFSTPKTVKLPDSNGESRDWKSPGSAEFVFHGQNFTLTPIENPSVEKPLFFVFGDLTNGHQTYGGGRFMYAASPKAGRVILDFNMATNPLCAYNHRMFICPSPHKDNRLSIPVTAGELTYPTPAS